MLKDASNPIASSPTASASSVRRREKGYSFTAATPWLNTDDVAESIFAS